MLSEPQCDFPLFFSFCHEEGTVPDRNFPVSLNSEGRRYGAEAEWLTALETHHLPLATNLGSFVPPG